MCSPTGSWSRAAMWSRSAGLAMPMRSSRMLQAGGRTVTTTVVRLDGNGLQPPPQLGFAGAAALDAQGRLFGMVTLKSPVVASTGTPVLPQAGVVPVERIRAFLEGRHVMPATGRAGVEAAKASVVRVICVRT